MGRGFGDDVVAAAMIDRLVHHAEVIALKGDSYRLKDRDLPRPHHRNRRELAMRGVNFRLPPGGQDFAAVDSALIPDECNPSWECATSSRG